MDATQGAESGIAPTWEPSSQRLEPLQQAIQTIRKDFASLQKTPSKVSWYKRFANTRERDRAIERIFHQVRKDLSPDELDVFQGLFQEQSSKRVALSHLATGGKRLWENLKSDEPLAPLKDARISDEAKAKIINALEKLARVEERFLSRQTLSGGLTEYEKAGLKLFLQERPDPQKFNEFIRYLYGNLRLQEKIRVVPLKYWAVELGMVPPDQTENPKDLTQEMLLDATWLQYFLQRFCWLSGMADRCLRAVDKIREIQNGKKVLLSVSEAHILDSFLQDWCDIDNWFQRRGATPDLLGPISSSINEIRRFVEDAAKTEHQSGDVVFCTFTPYSRYHSQVSGFEKMAAIATRSPYIHVGLWRPEQGKSDSEIVDIVGRYTHGVPRPFQNVYLRSYRIQGERLRTNNTPREVTDDGLKTLWHQSVQQVLEESEGHANELVNVGQKARAVSAMPTRYDARKKSQDITFAPKPGATTRGMFCSEFVVAVIMKAELLVNEHLQEKYGIDKDYIHFTFDPRIDPATLSPGGASRLLKRTMKGLPQLPIVGWVKQPRGLWNIFGLWRRRPA